MERDVTTCDITLCEEKIEFSSQHDIWGVRITLRDMPLIAVSFDISVPNFLQILPQFSTFFYTQLGIQLRFSNV